MEKMMKKDLLESLRALTPELKIDEEISKKIDEEISVKDVVEADDEESEEDDFEDAQDGEDEESDFEDEESEEDDFEDEEDHDDIHSLNLLKSHLNSADEEVQHAIVSFIQLLLDNDIDKKTLEDFIEEVDVDFEDEDDEDDFDSDLEDLEADIEDTEEDEEDLEDDRDKFEESFEEAPFTPTLLNESAAFTDMVEDLDDMKDLLD